jgi:membrane protein required for colicin V production
MNWIDIAIIVVGVLFALIGLWQGVIRTVFTLAGLIGGIVLAGHYYQPFANVLSPDGASWAGIAAFAIILVVTVIVVNILGLLVARFLHLLRLGWVDKAFGFIIGAGIGGMLCAAILTIISKYFPGMGQDVVSQSAIAKLLIEQFPLLLALLPEEFDFVRDFFQ